MAAPASPKIIPFEALAARAEAWHAEGRRIVQSHGIFDLIHPGHVCHLEEAKAFGDVLIVSVTDDRHVLKGPGRPYFTEQLRLRTLAALACVDYVVLAPFPGAVEAIARIRPHVFCRGKEYEDAEYDTSGALEAELRAVERVGGEVRFVGAIKHSSTRLLNLYFDHLGAPVKEFCNTLAGRYTRKAFVEAVERLAALKVLVVGETIFDRYVSVKVQGLTSKNRIISGRFLERETHCGGALAAFRHVRQFTPHVRFLSVVGDEPWVDALLREQAGPAEDLVLRDPAYTSIIKERFVEPRREGQELNKLFAVNYLDPAPLSGPLREQFEARLTEAMAACDAVLLLDFGHGLMTSPLRELVQERAPFLALNCQTNSNNHGFNVLSRQYRRADAFTLDEQELMLVAGRREVDFEAKLAALRQGLGARYAWLTRGPVETIGLVEGGPACLCPPLETEIVDTVGAGDAFFAVASLAAAGGLPVDLGTFLGQLAGAQAVRIVGNAQPISKETLVKAGMSLLNF